MSVSSQNTNFLFGTIQYQDEKALGIFIENLKPEQAIFVITEGIKSAHRKGSFELQESEILSKALRVLNSPQSTENLDIRSSK